MTVKECKVVLDDALGVFMVLKAYTSRFHDGSSLKQMFDAADNGELMLPTTRGSLKVTARRVGKMENRQWTVEGLMAHCSDCGDEYAGPLNCNCWGQRSSFVPSAQGGQRPEKQEAQK